ncbi:MAG TPA: NAD(P)/FAD-dependent oxidoreductase, partial [Acidimicrobiales bacterium]|nr:NAD(P)/FAD-dependent oxidoreductase [Acidimicrobiales bacterium]
AHAPEILEHSRRIGKHFGLYDNSLFHTEVTDLEWDQDRSVWILRTNRGDEFTAQFVGIGLGPLHVPKLPGIRGIEDFKGHSFHTSRWDYAYTGGDPMGAPMDQLADKRVALIGTGATAVQCIPPLAEACGELYVFQRTPSSVDVRDNRPTDPDWFAEIATPGWQRRWLENFTATQSGVSIPEQDLVMDGWTDLARRIRAKIMELPPGNITPAAMMAAFEESDFEKMSEIRARVDAIVEDGATAQALKAWYRQLCKRPCFHDEYLPAFNRPNTHLVDTDGKGVESITERGVVAGGVEYEVDCIIYASGFEVGTAFTRRAGFDITGREGLRLSDAWSGGMATMHGVHVHGFPNLFMVQVAQGANLIANVPHNFTEAGETIAKIIGHALDTGAHEVEVTNEAQDAWMDLLYSTPRMGTIGSPECTPGYYNNEGKPGAVDWFLGYPGGATSYFAYLDQWRNRGDFSGLRFR